MYKSSIFLLLLVFYNTKAQINDFCESNITFKHVFIISDQITFGTKHIRWSYNIHENSVISIPSDGESYDEFLTYVAFDFDPCKHDSQQFCNHSVNAKNLVLSVISNNFSSYRISCVKKGAKDFISIPITDNYEMPWNMSTHGTITGDKFFTFSKSNIMYTGLTFVSHNDTHALFATIVDRSFKSGNILVKRINKSGIIDNEWSIVFDGVFRGLFDVNGSVYALDNNNVFHLLEWDAISNQLFEKSTYNPKQLYNCYKNSSLLGDTFNMCAASENNTDDYVDDITIPSMNKTIPDNNNITNVTRNPTYLSGRQSLVWWSILLIMIVVAIVITAIICLIFGKKSKKQVSTQAMVKQTNNENDVKTIRSSDGSIDSE